MSPARLKKNYQSPLGFTLLELLLAVTIVGLIISIAVPIYRGYRERIEISETVTQIRAMEVMIKDYWFNNAVYPDTLAQAGAAMTDSWGRPYQYLRIEGNKKAGGKQRKDKNLVPINSDFDLYSMGEDGKSVSPLTAKSSRDDIVRANNGGFVGLAIDY